MKLHANAALTWNGRGRFVSEGEAGLADRCSAPHRVANRTRAERVVVIGNTIPTHALAVGSDIIGSTDALQHSLVPLLERRS